MRAEKTVDGGTAFCAYEGDRLVLELDQYEGEQARNTSVINLLARKAGRLVLSGGQP